MSEIDKALQIMEQLRDPDSGCPWDIKQTHSSIAKCSIEESYELISSIIKNDLAVSYTHLRAHETN